MSEYQYYEFQAVDRTLTEAQRDALRMLSSRAKISANRFSNSYNFGDFRGDPGKLMRECFDLHLYLANWGSRRLMIKLPKRLIDLDRVAFVGEDDGVAILNAGEDVIFDITREEVAEDDEWVDETREDSARLEALAPLREDLMGGDLRLFYVLWLMGVQDGRYEPDDREPMAWTGPLTHQLEIFADIFGLDSDLLQTATDVGAAEAAPASSARAAVQAMSEHAKTEALVRLLDGDPHVAAELRLGLRRLHDASAPARPLRSVGELLSGAEAVCEARRQAGAAYEAEQARQRAAAAAKARADRLNLTRRRGSKVWQEIESEVERRNAPGYDTATDLLADLRVIAEEKGTLADFARRLGDIRQRHAAKKRFIERIAGLESADLPVTVG